VTDEGLSTLTGSCRTTDRTLEPMVVRSSLVSHLTLECKDAATFSLLLPWPVPGPTEGRVVLDDGPSLQPEGGMVLNIFGVLYGRVVVLSRDVRLSLSLSTLSYLTSATVSV
jgi:hypothetical protein